ncbi:MAG: DNA polymerase III subunit beta [Nitrospirota bacterium]
MRIKIKTKELLLALQRVQGIVEKKTTIPILSNILINAMKNQGSEAAAGQEEESRDYIYVTGTDLDIGIKGRYNADVTEEGKITLSAKKIYEIVKASDEKEITIYTDMDNKHQVIIEAGRGIFKILGLAPEDYPDAIFEKDDIKMIEISGSILLSLIKKSIFAAGENDSKKILTGILLKNYKKDNKNIICMVGTDGRRLAVAESYIYHNTETEGETEIVIPRKALFEIRRLLLMEAEGEEREENVCIGIDKNRIIFEKKGFILISRLLEGSYPKYENFIPVNDKKLHIKRGEFEKVIKRVSILSQEKTMAVNLEITPDDKMVVLTNNSEIGEAREEMTVQYKGEDVNFRMNARYLLEYLSAVEDDDIIMELKDNESACLMRGENDNNRYIYIIMPMRIVV